MANHTITVISQGGNNNANQTNIDRTQSRSSSQRLTTTGGNRRVVTGITKNNTSFASKLFSSGAGGIVASATAIRIAKNGIKKSVNIYSNFMSAKTGETMHYQNVKQGVNFFMNPLNYVKQMVWDYGVIEPMRVTRENISLNYQRELTGNVIYSKYYNNGQF